LLPAESILESATDKMRLLELDDNVTDIMLIGVFVRFASISISATVAIGSTMNSVALKTSSSRLPMMVTCWAILVISLSVTVLVSLVLVSVSLPVRVTLLAVVAVLVTVKGVTVTVVVRVVVIVALDVLSLLVLVSVELICVSVSLPV
jgi:hypothetical protein